jgi:hypothetical protein
MQDVMISGSIGDASTKVIYIYNATKFSTDVQKPSRKRLP